MNTYTKTFKEIGIKDLSQVGWKISSLGEIFSKLSSKGILVPDGFAIPAHAFEDFLEKKALSPKLKSLMDQLHRPGYENLNEIGEKARALILASDLPDELQSAVRKAYKELGGEEETEVAVRSSATTEVLQDVSFAGQHESYLNVKGEAALLRTVRKCYASFYTDRAIKYRESNGFQEGQVALTVGVQKMVRSDKASSGIIFTLEPESGFRDIVHISGVWGLGENIVQGTVTPDEFHVFKPSLLQGKHAIVHKKLGTKAKTMICSPDSYGDETEPVINIDTPKQKRDRFVLTDEEAHRLARWALDIENHYQKPMDIEWAKDGRTNEIYIIEARPETVHSQKNPMVVKRYELLERGKVLTQGDAIGSKIVKGIARILHSPHDAGSLKKDEIIVADTTSPDWNPVMQKSSGLITNEGGRTSHAAIVAREFGLPTIVGCVNATTKIKDGDLITISCNEGNTGFVYEGSLEFTTADYDFSNIEKPETTEVMLIAGNPDNAYELSFFPNDGVGLMRIEFIITHSVQIHPMALVTFNELKDADAKQKIEELTHNYPNKEKYFVDKLAEGVATIAAAFYPKDVIVRMSDFKTNEYANLIGGTDFEPHEENPMLGFRGASRYYNDLYKEGFRLECEAIKKVREEMGLTNVKVMIPFCRTVEEGNKVIAEMKRYGLEQGVDDLEIYLMAEIPSNVVLAEKFAEIFDGFSIGSNDLTQLTLGIDRDSAIVSHLFSEQNAAPKEMIATMISKSKKAGRKIGLCGQAPSDFPEFARFLVEEGIDSISFNPDAVLKGIENIRKAENEKREATQAAQVF